MSCNNCGACSSSSTSRCGGHEPDLAQAARHALAALEDCVDDSRTVLAQDEQIYSERYRPHVLTEQARVVREAAAAIKGLRRALEKQQAPAAAASVVTVAMPGPRTAPQPEALRLAERLEQRRYMTTDTENPIAEAAAELRRLYQENQGLHKELKNATLAAEVEANFADEFKTQMKELGWTILGLSAWVEATVTNREQREELLEALKGMREACKVGAAGQACEQSAKAEADSLGLIERLGLTEKLKRSSAPDSSEI